MPSIEIKNLTKKYDDFIAVDNLSLFIPDNSFISLLGPSGCGKTTILRMIAGLTTPTSGKIIIGDNVVFDSEKNINISPNKRELGLIFQNYALWPNMNVYNNIAFALGNDKNLSKAVIKNRVLNISKTLKIDDLLERYIDEISGGQQQRVAIARTLVNDPQVILMDEPLSNLDAKLRNDMRYELKRLHHDTKKTFVNVTHDQLEAMTLSTKICLLNNGKQQQYEEPLELYKHPKNLFVAEFVGNINFIKCELLDINNSFADFIFENVKLRLEFDYTKENFIKHFQVNKKYTIGVRPEFIEISKDIKNKTGLFAEIFASMPSGIETISKLKINDKFLTTVDFGTSEYFIGDRVSIYFKGKNIILFDENDEAIIYGELKTL